MYDEHAHTQSVPSSVWRLNLDPPPDSSTTFGTAGDDRWWDQVDLVKLILADNLIRELSEEIQHLPALTVLDVRGVWCGECVYVCGWVGRRGWCVCKIFLGPVRLCTLAIIII